ncbi:MAG: hypothetical protein IKK33_09610 [Lachnospiraceae bacterium]|nr:hypothetical protein [Lachnospiraceae bacterium]
MNFKDSYKQINENRKPDKEFLNQLATQMEATQQQNKKRSIMPFAIPGTLTAAAAIICFILLRPDNTAPSLPSQDISLKADVTETFTPSHEFEHEKWDEGTETSDELLNNLQMLLQSVEIQTAYCADTNTFEKEDTLSTDDIALLTDAIHFAEKTEANVQGDCQYYMLVFANGNIVKFEIYDAKYLKIKGNDTFYLLSEKK